MAQPIRSRPGRDVVKLLKGQGVRQTDVARSAGCSLYSVNAVIHRAYGVSDAMRERVWLAIERALNGAAA